MGPKQKGVSSLLKENIIIQAVVIADSFDDYFDVFTRDRPKALIPLLNQPLIDYSLGLLKYNGIQEVFLFCSRHHKHIRAHVKKYWSDNSEMVVHVFSSDGYLSPGDVFRDLDSKALIKGEFILIQGDVVGNLPLMRLLTEHRARKCMDKGCVMTSVYGKKSFSHRKVTGPDEKIVITNLLGRVIGYETHDEGTKKIKIPLESFKEHSEIRIREDIHDTHISICSLNMLMSFTENVDHQSKDDFIRGSLVDQDIHGNSVYITVAENDYGGRVFSPRDYHMISQDLLCRWNHPVVPEKFLGCCKKRNNVYLHKTNKGDLVRCSLEKNVLIGSSTSLGRNLHIRNSVVGSHCKIGSNVSLDGVYLWDNVEVGDNCNISASIVANDVKIKQGVTLTDGCLISESVIIGPEIVLQKASVINCEDHVSDKNLVGRDGRGIEYRSEHDDNDGNMHRSNLGWIWESDESCRVEVGSLDNDDENESDSEGSDLDGVNEEEDVKIFFKELIENFDRGIREKISSDNLVLEVNSIKHAFNIPIDEVNVLVIQALLHLPDHMKGHFDGDFFSQIKAIFSFFLKLIKNYIKSLESQVICLQALEQFCLQRKEVLTTAKFCKIIMFLYDADVLEDESIIGWYNNVKSLPQLLVFEDDPQQMKRQASLRNEDVLIKLIKWLEEAEEESDSD